MGSPQQYGKASSFIFVPRVWTIREPGRYRKADWRRMGKSETEAGFHFISCRAEPNFSSELGQPPNEKEGRQKVAASVFDENDEEEAAGKK